MKLQANCRRYLAQKQAEKRRIQDSAIKCIQKNIRISFALKKWKWWRLYTQLMPIINVQNSENLLKQCKEELDELKRKNERLANEKSDLKLLNNQLETKVIISFCDMKKYLKLEFKTSFFFLLLINKNS